MFQIIISPPFPEVSRPFFRPLPLSVFVDTGIILSSGVAESESSTRKLVDVSLTKSLGLDGIVCNDLEIRHTSF